MAARYDSTIAFDVWGQRGSCSLPCRHRAGCFYAASHQVGFVLISARQSKLRCNLLAVALHEASRARAYHLTHADR